MFVVVKYVCSSKISKIFNLEQDFSPTRDIIKTIFLNIYQNDFFCQGIHFAYILHTFCIHFAYILHTFCIQFEMGKTSEIAVAPIQNHIILNV